jgi:enamine deaminase RidA (YjgF/YER057c/UK114 family)
MRPAFALLVLSLGACAATPEPDFCPPGIDRDYASLTAPFARTIAIPPNYETILLSGVVADPLPGGGFGDTEQQTESVLGKINAALKSRHLREGDVVAMTVYLVAPTPGGAMDFDGMMRAYSRHYGSTDQPHRPVRSTVQVAGLVRPGMLVEIEVTAAMRSPPAACDFPWQI